MADVAVSESELRLIMGYDKQNVRPTYVVYTNPQTFASRTVKVVRIYNDGELLRLKRINGDEFVASIREIELRVDYS